MCLCLVPVALPAPTLWKLDRTRASCRGLVRDVERGFALEKLGMDLRVGDIRDEASLRNVADGTEIIFNLVASCRCEPSESKIILLDSAQNIFRNVEPRRLKNIFGHQALQSTALRKRPSG